MISRKGAKAQRTESERIRGNQSSSLFWLCAFAPLRGILLLAAALVAGASQLSAAEPRLLVDAPGFGLELVAREHDVVTPIGLAFDVQGRLLVIESHTHQRPADYAGPTGDRIRMFTDANRDGRLDTWSTFAEGYQQAMNLCVRPDGAVYLVTRRDVRLLEDTNGDGKSDKETVILHLETMGDYPHNGMSGIAFRTRGTNDKTAGLLVVGVGENSGIPYTIVGSDGVQIDMRDGAGNVYVCQADGSGMRRYATGFWNPFALCFAGRNIYAVDNDPDSSPPCRLIDVWPAGDYGFRYQYGRAGVHPLLAWNGELPGTLPPVCGVGEAPTAIVFHHEFLWVTSWGDHRLERYSPAQSGTYQKPVRTASRQVVVQGDTDFRPTGCAVAPDGSIYFADWVDRSYPVHGRGRIWKLALPIESHDKPVEGPPHISGGQNQVYRSWATGMPFGRQLQEGVFDPNYAPDNLQWRWTHSTRRSIASLQAIRWHSIDGYERVLREALQDKDADIRLYAVRWIADERIKALHDDVAKLLDGEIPSERYFLAVLGAIDWLDGDMSMPSSKVSDGLLVRELKNAKRSDALHALALRLVSPDDPWLTIDRLREYLRSTDQALRLEAVRTLAMRSDPERLAVLAEIAGDAAREPELRAEAITGLAPPFGTHEELLAKLASDADPTVAREALRVSRLAGKDGGAGEAKPPASELDRWSELLATGGDAASGRRLFFTSVGPRCAVCHTHTGRGGRIGPDLTRLGAQQSRERIIASILQPSREIAPEFQAWTLVTADGLTHAGLRLPQGGDDGSETYADGSGQRFTLASETIAERTPSDASIMPDGLDRTLTVQDLRDLVEFLASGK